MRYWKQAYVLCLGEEQERKAATAASPVTAFLNLATSFLNLN